MDVLAPLRAVAHLALPPRCPGCGAVTIGDHRFCADCWGALRFLGPPWCAGCNVPFAFDRGREALCGRCHANPPPHAGVRAAVAYGDVARSVALRLKYGGRLANAETIARQVVRLMPNDADLLVPVPLHRWRLWGRGYNQAALIARALGAPCGVAVAPDLLLRRRATPPLRGLGARARAKAVQGVFAVDRRAAAALKDKHVVLVDDVFTSGATAEACTRTLRAAGSRMVTVLCWARVLPDTSD